MKKRWLLVGLVIGMSLLLGACSELDPTETTQGGGSGTGQTPSAGGGAVFVEEVDVLILESFPVQARVLIQGNLSDGCTEIEEISAMREEGANVFDVRIVTSRDPDLMCTQALVPFEETIDLEVYGLSAGVYTVIVHEVKTTFELAVDNVPQTG